MLSTTATNRAKRLSPEIVLPQFQEKQWTGHTWEEYDPNGGNSTRQDPSGGGELENLNENN